MAKLVEQIKSPKDLLDEEQTAWRDQQKRELGARLHVAEAVIEAGGVAEKDVFLFAMHGIMPGRTIGQEETAKVAFYDGLIERFAKAPIARKRVGYGHMPFISDLATPQLNEVSEPVLQYTIYNKRTRGFRGTVDLAVANHHTWDSLGGLEQPNVVAEATIRLAQVDTDKYGKVYDDDFTDHYLVGLEEITDHRQFDTHFDRDGDRVFLGRISMFLENTNPEEW